MRLLVKKDCVDMQTLRSVLLDYFERSPPDSMIGQTFSVWPGPFTRPYVRPATAAQRRGAIIAQGTASAGYAGALGSGQFNAGVIGGIVTGIVSYGFNKGGGLNPAAANGIGGAVGGAWEAGLAGTAMAPLAAAGAIGGLAGGLVQMALESGNDCGCGK
jgi:hypothetical protein